MWWWWWWCNMFLLVLFWMLYRNALTVWIILLCITGLCEMNLKSKKTWFRTDLMFFYVLYIAVHFFQIKWLLVSTSLSVWLILYNTTECTQYFIWEMTEVIRFHLEKESDFLLDSHSMKIPKPTIKLKPIMVYFYVP